MPRDKYREMLSATEKVKNPTRKLMNCVIDLLFTKEELAGSDGMEDREKREKNGKAIEMNVLDTLRKDAALVRINFEIFSKLFSQSGS